MSAESAAKIRAHAALFEVIADRLTLGELRVAQDMFNTFAPVLDQIALVFAKRFGPDSDCVTRLRDALVGLPPLVRAADTVALADACRYEIAPVLRAMAAELEPSSGDKK